MKNGSKNCSRFPSIQHFKKVVHREFYVLRGLKYNGIDALKRLRESRQIYNLYGRAPCFVYSIPENGCLFIIEFDIYKTPEDGWQTRYVRTMKTSY